MKQTKQKWPPAEAFLLQLPNRLHCNAVLVEIDVSVVFKFPRGGRVQDDWFVRVTAIASRWLPPSRPGTRAEITCLAHPRTTGMNASCATCIDIAEHRATSRAATSNQMRWHSMIHRAAIDARAAQMEASAGDLTTRC
jgi:hypothetical protein